MGLKWLQEEPVPSGIEEAVGIEMRVWRIPGTNYGDLTKFSHLWRLQVRRASSTGLREERLGSAFAQLLSANLTSSSVTQPGGGWAQLEEPPQHLCALGTP